MKSWFVSVTFDKKKQIIYALSSAGSLQGRAVRAMSGAEKDTLNETPGLAAAEEGHLAGKVIVSRIRSIYREQ